MTHVRPLRADDVSDVVALWNDAVETMGSGYERQSLTTDDLDSFRRGNHYLPSGSVVAEDGDGDRMVGAAFGYYENAGTEGGDGDTPGRLAGIAVHPDRWREGIGTELVETVEQSLRAAGRDRIHFFNLGQPVWFAKPILDSGPYNFFTELGYRPDSHQMRLRNYLDEFEITEEIRERRSELASEGVEIDFLDPADRQEFLTFTAEHFSGWHEKMKRATAGDDPEDVLVVREHGDVIGFIGAIRVVDEATGRGKFGTPGLRPDVRGRGIGKVMIYLGLDHLRDLGASYAQYTTGYTRMGDDAARKIYFDAGARLVEILCREFHKPL